MTKNDFLSKLLTALNKNSVADAEDIVSEYEQHFAFKLADGFSEEEIAAKLGDPAGIAAQFESDAKRVKSGGGGKIFLKIGLFLFAVPETLAYLLFFGWTVVVAAVSLASAIIGVGLLTRLDIMGTIPDMPYLSAVIFGVSLLAFALLLATGTCYFFAYLKQMVRSSVRWHKNVVSGGMLPPLPWAPQLSNKARRGMRKALLWSITVFGATFILGYVVSLILSGAWEFWHVWHWFVG